MTQEEQDAWDRFCAAQQDSLGRTAAKVLDVPGLGHKLVAKSIGEEIDWEGCAGIVVSYEDKEHGLYGNMLVIEEQRVASTIAGQMRTSIYRVHGIADDPDESVGMSHNYGPGPVLVETYTAQNAIQTAIGFAIVESLAHRSDAEAQASPEVAVAVTGADLDTLTEAVR